MRQQYFTSRYAAKALLAWKRFHVFGEMNREMNHFIREIFQSKEQAF